MTREVLLTGHTGLIGSKIEQRLKQSNFEITTIGRNKQLSTYGVDFTNKKVLERIFESSTASVFVHFAEHLPSVDAIESERNLGKSAPGYKINVGMVRILSELCQKYNKRFVFASTSYVFDGKNGPYSEDDQPSDDLVENLSFYGYIKRQEEIVTNDNCQNWASVRFEMPFRGDNWPKVDFARKIISLYKDDKINSMFVDQTITPVYIDYLATAVQQIIERDFSGYAHVGSSDTTSPHEFTTKLLAECGFINPQIKQELFTNYIKPADRAPRPHKGGIVGEKTRTKIGLRSMSSSEMITTLVKELKDNGII